MSSAYLDALKMLARRDLSEAQVRQRLARRGHEEQTIDEAIDRLKNEGAIDDLRTASGIARVQTRFRGRGRRRVQRQIEGAGIDPTHAKRAVDDLLGEIDEDALLEASLARRLRGRTTVADDADLQRLYRYLVGQGFEHDRIVKALESLKKRGLNG